VSLQSGESSTWKALSGRKTHCTGAKTRPTGRSKPKTGAAIQRTGAAARRTGAASLQAGRKFHPTGSPIFHHQPRFCPWSFGFYPNTATITRVGVRTFGHFTWLLRIFCRWSPIVLVGAWTLVKAKSCNTQREWEEF